MNQPLLPGMEHEARNIELSQWYTPPWLADELWIWWSENAAPRNVVGQTKLFYVIEPAAGDGALIKPALASNRCEHVLAIDIDPLNIVKISQRFAGSAALRVMCADFLALSPLQTYFHVCLQNPPYEDGLDVKFILRGLRWAPEVAGIYRSAILHGQERFERLWRWVDIVRGKILTGRPEFGVPDAGAKARSNGPESDYVLLQMRKRLVPRERGEKFTLELEWSG